MIYANKEIDYIYKLYTMSEFNWLDGRVVMQRPAKPLTPVRFRIQPPSV
jgi:hypothetical protein